MSISHQVSSFLSEVFFPVPNIVQTNGHVNNPHQPIEPPKLTVAFSGGLDSCVLLHVLSKLSQTAVFQLTAHHVHHGLSQHADDWADFCQAICAQLNVPLIISTVQIDTKNGLGIESAARQARYRALFSNSPGFICTAHHQDDQAETLLLQLARGAGVKGLAAMSSCDAEKKLLRPLLGISRAELELYAKQHQLTWVEDESNADQRFDRNFMRHSILPMLQLQYPAIKQNLARSAGHLAEANELLDELAMQDAVACFSDQQSISQLFLPPLQSLSHSRINNVLRWWLLQNRVRMPTTSQLQQITAQLFVAKANAAIKIRLTSESGDMLNPAKLSLRRYQQSAYVVAENASELLLNKVWNNESVMHFSNQGELRFNHKLGEGFALKYLHDKQLVIKNRAGGERFKLDLNRPRRSLKAVLQSAGVPPWQREQLPLVYLDNDLVIIPNIAVDAHFKAHPDEMGLIVTWHEAVTDK